jgi:hypothetical protein
MGPVSNRVMRIRAAKLIGIVLLIGATALQGSKGVPAIVSISHVTQDGKDLHETRVHVMRDHTVYIEEITQHSSARPTCTQFRAVLPDSWFHRLEKLMDSPEFKATHTQQGSAQMGTGSDDVWHFAFRLGKTQFFVFKAPESAPPSSFVSWYDETRHLRPPENIRSNWDSYECIVFSEEMAEAWRR